VARDRTVPESTILLEYVDRLSEGPRRLVPQDLERALECRLRDRLWDTYIHAPVQKIVGDRRVRSKAAGPT
jgi:glutathione S-transferase